MTKFRNQANRRNWIWNSASQHQAHVQVTTSDERCETTERSLVDSDESNRRMNERSPKPMTVGNERMQQQGRLSAAGQESFVTDQHNATARLNEQRNTTTLAKAPVDFDATLTNTPTPLVRRPPTQRNSGGEPPVSYF